VGLPDGLLQNVPGSGAQQSQVPGDHGDLLAQARAMLKKMHPTG